MNLGSAGFVHRDRQGKVRHHVVRPASAVSAHGAGDVFVGALAARMAAPAQMEDAIAYAQATAARFVSPPSKSGGIRSRPAAHLTRECAGCRPPPPAESARP